MDTGQIGRMGRPVLSESKDSLAMRWLDYDFSPFSEACPFNYVQGRL